MTGHGFVPVVALFVSGAPAAAVAQECPSDTTRGTLVVEVGAGPNGEPLTVAVTGPGEFAQSVGSTTTYDAARAGPYRARVTRGERVIVSGSPVGRAWSPAVRAGAACVRTGSTARLSAGYLEEPGAHKLWIVDDMANAALSLPPATFAAAGAPVPAARLQLAMNKAHAVAFDRDGNLWIADISGQIASYGVWSLGRSGQARARTSWTGPAVADPVALAFDAAGGLWVAARQQRVSRFAPEQLGQARAPAPQVTLEVTDPAGLAFDARGNLWVASAGNVSALLRYDAARLDGSRPGPPDATIVAMSAPPVIDQLRGPAGMAFDRDGNLWVGYFGPNVIARLTPNDLRASGEVTPAIQLGLSVAALLEGLAFDESGALWVPGESGQVLRLTPAQLRRSGPVAPDVTLAPEGLRYGVGLALNPMVSWGRR
jgi:sugar lactone lactonase YvrE